ncbi:MULTISPECIES: hypothetical protein [unclassified Rhizobacter]|uniref:hypothetical protein n=1 Tax=unclassified Rhizobacter TaxID=2640088 RepID=UPI000B303B68|nr:MULTISPECIES: hypothetical protein [unclassified Rhizobacter]
MLKKNDAPKIDRNSKLMRRPPAIPKIPLLRQEITKNQLSAYFLVFRTLVKGDCAKNGPLYELPRRVVDKVARYNLLLNDQISPGSTKKFEKEIFKAGGDHLALAELRKEKQAAAEEGKWQRKWKDLMERYALAAGRGDDQTMNVILRAAAKAEAPTRHCANLMIGELEKAVMQLQGKLKQQQTHGGNLRPEHISSLSQIAARRYAKMKQNAAEPELHKALRAAAGLLDIVDVSACAFTINEVVLKQMARTENSDLHNKVLTLISWLLLVDVDLAQELWDAVKSNSKPNGREFMRAQQMLREHLEKCDAHNTDRWKRDPKLNEKFCVKWANFKIDFESDENPKSSKPLRSPRKVAAQLFKSKQKNE